jgi:hypothetical protein
MSEATDVMIAGYLTNEPAVLELLFDPNPLAV